MLCPNCHTEKLRRSHSRTLAERAQKLIGRLAFRCENCGWRGVLRVPGYYPGTLREWLKWLALYASMTLAVFSLAVTYARWSAWLGARPFYLRIGLFLAVVLLGGLVLFKAPFRGVVQAVFLALIAIFLLMSVPAVFFY
jgi:hypothetical protein